MIRKKTNVAQINIVFFILVFDFKERMTELKRKGEGDLPF